MNIENFLHEELEKQIRDDMERSDLQKDKNFYLFMLDINSKLDFLITNQKNFMDQIETNPTVKLGALFQKYPKVMSVLVPLSFVGLLVTFLIKETEHIKLLLGLQ